MPPNRDNGEEAVNLLSRLTQAVKDDKSMFL
jgi:hypothetical protein